MVRALLAACTILIAVPATAQLPPDARWRTFDTDHFRVTFEEALEPIARRAGDRAERAYAVLASELTDPPRGRIDLVIAGSFDLANGYATPIPTNRVVIFAHPPVSETSLSYYDDWLDLVILHELVHIFHLDAASGVWERLRLVFGRSPVLFPHFLNPGWLVEGLATAYESRLTSGGRVRGTAYEMMLRTAVLQDELFTIDRATADPIRWPAGTTRYLYGAFFVDDLARRYGTERVSRFIEEYGGRLVPYRLNSAARVTFGVTLSEAWEAWADSLRVRYGALADSVRAAGLTEVEMLTSHGRGAYFPRFSRDGSAIAYAAATGRDEPAVRVIDASGNRREEWLATQPGPSAWMPDGSGLLTSRLDYVGPHRVFADLHLLRADGGARRLTRGARMWEPDVHPAGQTAVAVTDADGTNALAVHDLATGASRVITTPNLDVHWAWPRWSSDGGRIAATRWSAGGLHDVVILDRDGRVVLEVTRDRALDAAPAWSPDDRYLLFSSDRSGISNLYAYELATGELRQVTNVLTGASQPDVSPDGRWIVFSLYGVEGYDIARIPFDPAGWRPAPAVRAEAAVPVKPMGHDAAAGGPTRRYSAFPSVLPAAWNAVLTAGSDLGIGIGAGTSGRDVVGRHEWKAEATVYPDGLRTSAGAAYRYNGLGNPALEVSGEQWWDVRLAEGEVVIDGEVVPSAIFERERRVEVGTRWTRPRWRSTSWIETRAELGRLELEWERPDAARGVELVEFPADAGGALAGGYSSARAFGVSIGPQEGITLAGQLEGHRYLRPLEGEADVRGYTRATVRSRAFEGFDLAGFAPHVLALRADFGVERGSLSPGFAIGGASGTTVPGTGGFDLLGGGLRFPVRGYPVGAQQGNRAATAGAEYRFPIALVERGIGLVPVSLGRVWGDLFVDAGVAWCAGSELCVSRLGGNETVEPLYSVGVEAAAHLRVGFLGEVPVRVGLAVPLSEEGRTGAYVRLGRSF